jgi:hypothetical protein
MARLPALLLLLPLAGCAAEAKFAPQDKEPSVDRVVE